MLQWKRYGLIIAGGVLMLLGLTGCEGGGGLVSIDQATEIRIGQQAAADIERQYGVVNDPAQLSRIQRIGRALATVSSRPGLPWSFRILNDNSVNAVSLPGGPVYVTRGLLAQGVSDNELAGVLGHEVAHINQRHAVMAIQRALTYQVLASLVLRNSSEALQTAANLAVEYAVELPRSREAEYESDDVGMRLAYNAGYTPYGLVNFLQRLQQLTGRGSTPEWMRTHPLTEERIARANQLAAQLVTRPRPVPVALERFDRDGAKNTLVRKGETYQDLLRGIRE